MDQIWIQRHKIIIHKININGQSANITNKLIQPTIPITTSIDYKYYYLINNETHVVVKLLH